MVDCTWSMKDHIVAVKDIVQKLRDQLAREFKGCDLRFSFVRYTDHDLSEDTMPRTTMLDFTRCLYNSYVFIQLALYASCLEIRGNFNIL